MCSFPCAIVHVGFIPELKMINDATLFSKGAT
jgi:hypothetical protein